MTTGTQILYLLFEFVALTLVVAIASLLALVNITQFLDQLKISANSQLMNGIFNDHQKLLKCFNGTTNLILSLFA